MNKAEKSPPAWVKKAESDLLCIRNELNSSQIPWDIVCFHAQQAAEKYLKAFLVTHKAEPDYTHDLIRLLRNCAQFEASLASLEKDCRELNSYAADVRYPSFDDATDEIMGRAAVAATERICETIRRRLPKS